MLTKYINCSLIVHSVFSKDITCALSTLRVDNIFTKYGHYSKYTGFSQISSKYIKHTLNALNSHITVLI